MQQNFNVFENKWTESIRRCDFIQGFVIVLVSQALMYAIVTCNLPLYFRQEERKNAMLMLIRITREGTADWWDEHFKTILLLLLETLGDNDVRYKMSF